MKLKVFILLGLLATNACQSNKNNREHLSDAISNVETEMIKQHGMANLMYADESDGFIVDKILSEKSCTDIARQLELPFQKLWAAKTASSMIIVNQNTLQQLISKEFGDYVLKQLQTCSASDSIRCQPTSGNQNGHTYSYECSNENGDYLNISITNDPADVTIEAIVNGDAYRIRSEVTKRYAIMQE